MLPDLPTNLADFSRKIRSQNGEDGIIEAIFAAITPRRRFFVEFGIGPNWDDKSYTNGLEGNCVHLRETGWDGLMMDGGTHPPSLDVRREFITPLNINALLRKYAVPADYELISIDVDGQDLWIWMALDSRPALVIVEYNPFMTAAGRSVSVRFDPSFAWDGSQYFGASVQAFSKLAEDKNYQLVHANGVNAFFVDRRRFGNASAFANVPTPAPHYKFRKPTLLEAARGTHRWLEV